MDIALCADRAGIIGASGSGYPLAARLANRVDVVIANGAECEPLLASDRAVLLRQAPAVLEGLSLVMAATGAGQGILAVRGSQKEVLAVAEKAIRGQAHLKVVTLPEQYPIGDVHVLVPEITGRVVPEGGRPEAVGVLVANVHTLWQLRAAVEDEPVTWRYVTVGGEVGRPGVYRVPVGTRVGDLAQLCGGIKITRPVFILGGPMQGTLTEDEATPVGKAHGGVFVLAADHPWVEARRRSVVERITQAASACAGCRMCTDYCPRHQMGHALVPHLLVRTLALGGDSPAAITAAPLCSGCGVCEVICPAGLSPRSLYGAVKQELVNRGWGNEHHRHQVTPTGELADRRLTREQVLRRTGLTPYDGVPLVDVFLAPGRVRIPLAGPVGDAAEPLVEEGQQVGVGQPIARPRPNSLSAWAHASIPGKVTRVGAFFIEIVGRG